MRHKRTDAISETGQSKRCSTCGFTKPLTEFNKNHKSKDGHQYSCRECTQTKDRRRLEDPIKAQANRDKTRTYYHNNKEQVMNYESDRNLFLKMKAVYILGGKCEECGEDHPAALQFHHIDPKEKSFNLSSKTLSATVKFPWEEVLIELKKCKLLCANCHAKHHTVWKQESIDRFRKEFVANFSVTTSLNL